MNTRLLMLAFAVGLAGLFPNGAFADYSSSVTGSTATMTGDSDDDTLTITQSGGLFRHNRFAAGDAGFNSEFDFHSGTAGDQTLSATTDIININAGDGNDTIELDNNIDIRGAVNGGNNTDTISFAQVTTSPVRANLGIGTTGLAATLGGDQIEPPTTHAGTGTVTVTNYDITTRAFDIAVTVADLPPADVTGFHIHQGLTGTNGAVIVDLINLASRTPSGTGFTFNATGVTLPSGSEAAFLGGGTYVVVHTAAFAAGAIRGQLFSAGNVTLGSGVASNTTGVTNVENVTGGAGDDSLVGSSGVNTINGGGGADFIVGGPGGDTMNGNAGADIMVWSNGDGSDVMEGGADSDTVNVNGSTAGSDAFLVSANGTRLQFNRTNLGLFALDIGTTETLTVNGIAGNDQFTISSLTGVEDIDAINQFGFEGTDTFTIDYTSTGTRSFNVHGGPGTDTLEGGDFTTVWNVTSANSGNITGLVASFRFIEVLSGGTETDTFNVKAFTGAPLTIAGNTGTDTLNYNAQGRGVAGDIVVPDGSVTSPTVDPLTFTGIDFFDVVNPRPTTNDFDADGKTDLTVYRPDIQFWFTLGSSANYTTNRVFGFGLPGDLLTPADFDNDGETDIAVYRPFISRFLVQESSVDSLNNYAVGVGTDIPVPGDYDGDQLPDPAVYRPSTGSWLIQKSTTNYVTTDTIAFGTRTDIPVPGDFDGDGILDLAVYSPDTGTWKIRTSISGFATTLEFQWGLEGDIPVPGDYDGDGSNDIAVWRPSTGTWFYKLSTADFLTSAEFQFGLPGDVPVPGDYDGDGKIDFAVWRPSSGTWFFAPSSTNYQPVMSFQWGLPDDVPTPNETVAKAIAISRRTVANSLRTADLDGDGRADINVYRPATGTWYHLKSGTFPTYGVSQEFQWGLPGDTPVSSDYDGDGAADLAVWRSISGEWFLRNSSSGFTSADSFQWGLQGDIPSPGDFDGDGEADLTVWRPSTGDWFLRHSTTDYTTSENYQWGLPGDVPVAGDYDGDSVSDLAIWRRSTGVWYLRYSKTSFMTNAAFQWGLSTDIAVPGDYDGDGQTDLAIWRASNGRWLIRQSKNDYNTVGSVQWGLSGDVPAPNDFDADGKMDPSVFRPANGTWFVLPSASGYDTPLTIQWGLNGDVPILPRQ